MLDTTWSDVFGARDSFTLGFEAKAMFFDGQRVLDAVDAAERRVLSRFGAFLRTRARSKIRSAGKRGAVSEPGQPPRWHVPEPNLRTIYFAYEPLRHTVVVGPVALNQKPTRDMATGRVPGVLERGGGLILFEREIGGKWFSGRPRSKRRFTGRTRHRTVLIKARPFMAPSLAEEAPKFPSLWADQVGRQSLRAAA